MDTAPGIVLPALPYYVILNGNAVKNPVKINVVYNR